MNCLPMNLDFKLSKINYDMVREPDSFSRISLSRLGSPNINQATISTQNASKNQT